jgi:riboflavin synthase
MASSLQVDQSVCHDGVCLTIIQTNDHEHTVEVVFETLSKTNLGSLIEGSRVNLEKAITPMTLLDGHLVQGHVDTTLICLEVVDLDGSWKMKFNLPDEYNMLIIPQGSVCINGVSLTVADVSSHAFDVAIIPYTFQHTSFQHIREGDAVNVEFDLIGKYIVRQMELRTITE